VGDLSHLSKAIEITNFILDNHGDVLTYALKQDDKISELMSENRDLYARLVSQIQRGVDPIELVKLYVMTRVSSVIVPDDGNNELIHGVYFASFDKTPDYVKIGYSDNFQQRKTSLKTQYENMKVLLFFETIAPAMLEKQFHTVFKAYRQGFSEFFEKKCVKITIGFLGEFKKIDDEINEVYKSFS
jgi:hypothetical protein